MPGDDADHRPEYVERAVRLAVLTGVGVALALVGLVVVGMSLRIEGVGAPTFVRLLLLAVLLWPVYRLAPWQQGVAERVRGWVGSNRRLLALAAAVIAGSRLSAAPDVLATVVDLPLVQTAGFFFGVELVYRPHVGFEFGQFIRAFGQWYVATFFVLGISVVAIDLGKWVRSAVGGGR